MLAYIRSGFNWLRSLVTTDAGFTLLAFVFGAAFAAHQVSVQDINPEYFMRFQPAVSFACGHSFANPMPAGYPYATPLPVTGIKGLESVEQFLSHNTAEFNRDSFPRSAASGPLYGYQRMQLYSIALVALLWKWFGIRWSVIWVFQLIMCGSTAALGYLITRQFVRSRMLSLAVPVLHLSSPAHLRMLTYFRDYSRAPFLLLAFLLIAVLLRPTRSTRAQRVLCAVLGAIVGLGLGFRTDLLAIIPLFALASLFVYLAPVRPRFSELPIRLGLFAVGLLLVGGPILKGYWYEGFSGFFRDEGLVTPFNEALGLRIPFYDVGANYNDYYSVSAVGAHAARVAGRPFVERPEGYPDGRKAAAILSEWSDSYYQDWLRHFPADFIVRVYRSTAMTATLPLQEEDTSSGWLSGRRWLTGCLGKLPYVGLGIVMIAMYIAFRRSRPLGAYLFGLVVFFGALNTVQFATRHIFYLGFIFWLCLILLTEAAIRLTIKYWKREAPERRTNAPPEALGWQPYRSVARHCAIGAAAGAAAFVLLAAARNYQSRSLRQFVAESQANARPIAYRVLPSGSRELLVSVPFEAPATNAPHWSTGKYLLAVFDFAGFAGAEATVTLHHTGLWGVDSFERRIKLSVHGDKVQIMFPAYYGASPLPVYDERIRFEGLIMQEDVFKCLKELKEVPFAGGSALTPYVVLDSGWTRQPAFLVIQ